MRDWGRYVGNRYGSFDNVFWCIGGDADPTPVADKLREFIAGLREFDTENLITAHNHRGTTSLTYWPNEPWLQVNSLFTATAPQYATFQAAYAHEPAMPWILLEGHYENEFGSSLDRIRAQNYWSMLAGSAGVIFGNCPIWHFGLSSSWCGQTDWQAQLSRPGSVQMTHFRALFESRHWEKLVPDPDGLVLTSGAGSFGSEEYALAAAASDGSSIIAYVPTPRELAFDTSVLTGTTVRAWWFDPRTAVASLIGEFPNGQLTIPPSPPEDWVLVLDDAARGFAAPGTPLPVTDAPVAPPIGARLHPNVPNPFNPRTEIRFELALSARVTLSIFDGAGRCVRRLLDRVETAGAHVLSWDGRDDAGRALASGVYVCRLSTAGGELSRKLILLK
jgi:hypothetical protein